MACVEFIITDFSSYVSFFMLFYKNNVEIFLPYPNFYYRAFFYKNGKKDRFLIQNHIKKCQLLQIIYQEKALCKR